MALPERLSRLDLDRYSAVLVARFESVTPLSEWTRYSPDFRFVATVVTPFVGGLKTGQVIEGESSSVGIGCPVYPQTGENWLVFLNDGPGSYTMGWGNQMNASARSPTSRKYIQQIRRITQPQRQRARRGSA